MQIMHFRCQDVDGSIEPGLTSLAKVVVFSATYITLALRLWLVHAGKVKKFAALAGNLNFPGEGVEL